MRSSILILLLPLLTSANTGDETGLFPGDVKRFQLQTDTQYEFPVTISSAEALKLEGFIFQTHTQRHAVTLSESSELEYGKYVTGTNVGLWKTLTNEDNSPYTYTVNVSCSLHCNGQPENVTVMVAVTTVDINGSIPGGCTMTSPLETDPNIRLNYTSYTTSVYFEDGNVGYDPHKEDPKDCTKTYSHYDVPTYKRVKYSVYHKVLSVGDYSESHMFDAIEDILTATSISKNKDDLPNFKLDSSGVKKTVIDSYAGDGVVYNVLAEVDGYPSTAYVPAVTYSCEFVTGQSGCQKNLDIVKGIVGALVCIVGLFLVFAAHRLFHVEVFVFSSLIFMFLLYLGVAKISFLGSEGEVVLAVRLSISVVLGMLVGGLCYLLWFFSGWYLPSVLLFTASAGFLILATLMYAVSFTVVDTIAILKIGYVYFLLFGCIVVLVLIPAVILPRAMNIFSSALVGGYLIVFGIGLFYYTSLSEVLMRVVKNATVSGYMKSEASYPFQWIDIVLSVVWLVLVVLGICIQTLLVYKREAFPEKSPYKHCMEKIRKRNRSVPSERKRLLDNYCSSPTEHVNINF